MADLFPEKHYFQGVFGIVSGCERHIEATGDFTKYRLVQGRIFQRYAGPSRRNSNQSI
jgi:hypothetical protein